MANTTRNFLKGRMNKALDKRLIPDGEYTDALNIRLGSTTEGDIGSLENSEGNSKILDLTFNDVRFGDNAICLGAFEDGANETMYWFVHQPSGFTQSATGKIDAIVSYNALTGSSTYHLVSCDDGGGIDTTLNFSEKHLINAVNLVDDLLFFTDNYNPPRRINVKKSYPQPISYIDDTIVYDDILVVKAPPSSSPNISSSLVGGQENFLEEKFICFAYRYRYEEDEYSATSEWSKPSFSPKPFSLSSSSYLNEGMTNSTNSCTITFNSGNDLVVGVDLLFKEIANNTIFVIEKLNKVEQGYLDNTDYQYSFTNSKIYTVLPSEEILRAYDNVPLLSKAQTIMGNRLMYGNYVEGWNLNDKNGNATQLSYQTVKRKEEIDIQEIDNVLSEGEYDYGPSTNYQVNNCRITLQLADIEGSLVQGSSITMNLQFSHESFQNNGMAAVPTVQTQGAELTWTYILPQDFATVTELFNYANFQNSIGTSSNIEDNPDDYCSGITLTDLFNCALLDALTGGSSTVYKYKSGIDAESEPVLATHSPGSSNITFQFPAMRYVENTSSPSIGVYEYYSVNPIETFFQKTNNTQSLHSNRGYEIGIVYMDDFSRATTVLTSDNNTAFFPCGDSLTKNSIQVTIPPNQVAPYFAKRYRFVIKADADTYDTIYSSIYFYDPISAHNYFLVEGENAAKSQEGTRLIVKKDVDGPIRSCVYATVLSKTVEQQGFILEDDENYIVPQGVYLKIKVDGFNASLGANSFINPGTQTEVSKSNGFAPTIGYEGLSGPANSSGDYQVLDIPGGSKIKYKFKFTRLGRKDGEQSTCGRRTYEIEQTFTASTDYNDIIAWFNGDGIEASLDNGVAYVGGGGAPFVHTYISSVTNTANNNYGLSPTYTTSDVIAYRWYKSTETNEIRFVISATPACGSSEKKQSKVEVTWEVVRSDDLVVFETEPISAAPDVWYESSESYSIDNDGNHSGNVVNQDVIAGTTGVVDTAFFNCFSYGNGVESYKVRDSAAGRVLSLGNRVTSVSAQDYKQAHRFSDITYSGVFNNETNVNKLNVFNLGLVNFQALEESFGPIQVLYGRETDVLILQEDKISYVLAGKNLLSDSTGGGAVSSVPEVLGTQIARIEEYGISNNPESFVRYGPDSFFTDAKRGAVINLRGSGPQEQLTVISEQGMRAWFRDMFISNFNTQKLGGFDPYMNEYVLANKTTLLPVEESCSECGLNRNFVIEDSSSTNFCVEFGTGVGDVTYTFYMPVASGASITFNVDGASQGPYTNSGSFIVNSGVTNTKSQIEIVNSGTEVNLNLTVSCPELVDLKLVLVTLNSSGSQGKTIHNQYGFVEGTYVSPTQSTPITVDYLTGLLIGGFLSDYQIINGQQGIGAVPTNSSTVTLGSNKTSTDTLDFDVTYNKFYWLASNTLYGATSSDIQSLISNANSFIATQTTIQPFTGSFTAPANLNTYTYLYLVWDYRVPTLTSLCYSASSSGDACCSCGCTGGSTITVENNNNSQITFRYADCTARERYISLAANQGVSVCSNSSTIFVTSGDPNNVVQYVSSCGCCPE